MKERNCFLWFCLFHVFVSLSFLLSASLSALYFTSPFKLLLSVNLLSIFSRVVFYSLLVYFNCSSYTETCR